MTIKNNFYIDDFIVSCLINIVFLDTTNSVFVFQIPVFVFFHTQEPSLVAFSNFFWSVMVSEEKEDGYNGWRAVY
jgi:hypothetical protein